MRLPFTNALWALSLAAGVGFGTPALALARAMRASAVPRSARFSASIAADGRARAPRSRQTRMSSSDFSSEIENVPLWVAERPLLPGFQERASVELCNWWYSHDAPTEVARLGVNSSVGTLVHVFTVSDELRGGELAVVMQARMRIKVLRTRTREGLQYADVQLMPDREEVSAHLDLAVHALGQLPQVGSWLRGAQAEAVVRSIAHASAATTARSWAPYECSRRIGSFKFGVTELVCMNRTVSTLETGRDAHARAMEAASQAARLANMRWGVPARAPSEWLADGPAPDATAEDDMPGAGAEGEDGSGGGAASRRRGGGSSGRDGPAAVEDPPHVILAASTAARYLASRGQQADDGSAALSLGPAVSIARRLQEAEWALWLSIDCVWFLLSKLSAKSALLLPNEVLQLQPPPPPGGWEHQYCMQQGLQPVDSSAQWQFDEAYPVARRAQRLSFVASSLMPGAPQQQILELEGIADRLRFLKSVFDRHEMALRSLVALQEIEADTDLLP